MSATAWTGKKPAGVEKTVNVLDKLSWTVQPPLGLICGDYFRVENNFAPHHALDRGYHGILEVVEKDGKLLHIEFNEINSPSYYNRYYQNASKRRSDYCFFQATKERTAQSLKVLDNGFTAVEQQMLRENRLTGDFDLAPLLSSSGSLNYGRWQDALGDALLSAFQSAQGEARAKAAADLFAYLNQQAPIVPVCFKNGSVLTQWGRLSGLSPVRGNVFYQLENWKLS